MTIRIRDTLTTLMTVHHTAISHRKEGGEEAALRGKWTAAVGG